MSLAAKAKFGPYEISVAERPGRNGRGALLLSRDASMKKLQVETADRAARYVAGIATRRVVPLPAEVARLESLGGPLPQLPVDPSEVLSLLYGIGSPST